MFKTFDSKEKRNIKDVLKEYPNSKCVFYLDAPFDEDGILLAVSTDSDSFGEYCSFINTLTKSNLYFAGDYDELSFGVLEEEEV